VDIHPSRYFEADRILVYPNTIIIHAPEHIPVKICSKSNRLSASCTAKGNWGKRKKGVAKEYKAGIPV
jgi:hypothetical protein